MNNVRIVATRTISHDGEIYHRGDVLRGNDGNPLAFNDHVQAWLYINEHITKKNDNTVPWVSTRYPREYK